VVPELGYPIANEKKDATDHPYQEFETGTLQCASTCAFMIYDPVHGPWWRNRSALGLPLEDVRAVGSSGAIGANFERGIVYVRSDGTYIACRDDGRILEQTIGITDCSALVSQMKGG
jgi:uncharacterized protein with LGFP repeats